MFYVITYDISSDKRRKKVSDLLEGYGLRVQLSVFECTLEDKKFHELCKRLEKRIKLDEDSIRIYPISQHTFNKVITYGGVAISSPPCSYVV